MRTERAVLRSLGLTLVLVACASLAQAVATDSTPQSRVGQVPPAQTTSPTLKASAPLPRPQAPMAQVKPVAALPAPQILGTRLNVTLKDGQYAEVNLVNYDRFFLSVVNAKGTHFDIPWTEVAAVDGPSAGDLALMRGNLTPETDPVLSVIEYRSPREALRRALWPGVLLHGSGLRYAGDNSSFVGLAGGEFFGLVLGAFGAYLQLYPSTGDSSLAGPQALVTAGVACFVGTWLWDLAFSEHVARQLDVSRGLALEPAARGEGIQVAYHY